MKIKKIFNNNVILVSDGEEEMIVMGKGIGFNQGESDQIDPAKIDKKFVLATKGVADKLATLINEIPDEHLMLSNKIIELANESLETELNVNIYITLTDHISYAIERVKQGLLLKNPLAWEVKKFYKEEYHVALQALDIINEASGIRLPEDEAGSIALHLVNAQQGEHDMEQTMAMTQIVTDLLQIVKLHYGIEINEDSMNYNRFMTHLRYFAYRVLRDEFVPEDEDSLYDQVRRKYPAAYKCSKKMVAYLEKNFNKKPTKEELVYFMIHIHRVTSRETKNS
ncbi:BglG family transcription antiterminator LicT [Paraliobacillus sediminis]|uniref:BglG family transcription antiterminator LicT n=1 Tax=Paraliobacillus sediminis TaxID=1885916 RepID=UPI000E3C783D|nr:PRD domain-containing protein [Paraliobacillus sediminis]